MSTDTIDALKAARDELKSGVKNIKLKEYDGRRYGAESEYDIRGLIAGVDAIISDVGGLLRAPKRFLQASGYSERLTLVKVLKALTACLADEDMESVCNSLETLKPVLRSYGARYSDERLEEFVERTNELQRKVHKFSELIEVAERSIVKIEEMQISSQELSEKVSSQYGDIKEQYVYIVDLIAEAEETRKNISLNFEADKANSSEVESLLAEVRSHAEIIETFSKKVAARENQLESQEEKSKEFNSVLSKYSLDQKNYIVEAEGLIDSAKQALEYKTAEGLSAAFIEQHRQAKDPWLMWTWVAGAMIFILLSAGLGIWLMMDHEISIGLIIGRVSLLPILIGGSVFCASQYIKQKNIAEDYAYKSVLAKSLVGFSEQLSSDKGKGEEYVLYIKTVLSQILVDPLRKQTLPNQVARSIGNKQLDLETLKKALEKLPEVLEKLAKRADAP